MIYHALEGISEATNTRPVYETEAGNASASKSLEIMRRHVRNAHGFCVYEPSIVLSTTAAFSRLPE